MNADSSHYQQIEQFFAGWQTYQKIIAHNDMCHREIADHVRRLIAVTWEARPFSMLDLGCGDAACIAPVLARTSIASYTGVDLAQAALDVARRNVAVLNCPTKLLKANYQHLMETLTGPYDFIFNSYSLHHLQRADKATYFERCARLLSAQGMHVLVDVRRRDDESQGQCVARQIAALNERSSTLESRERDAMAQHMRDNDLPETEATLRAFAAQAGLDVWEVVFVTPLYGMWVCRRAA